MRIITAVVLFLIILGGIVYFVMPIKPIVPSGNSVSNIPKNDTDTPNPDKTISGDSSFPLEIAAMKQKSYPGSKIIIEKTLSSGKNYNRYLVSYFSDGLKIYGLLTVPLENKPASGWPVILFNHGYIPPKQYSTENSYSVMIDPLASAGYIIFKPDYRGNGNSQGIPNQVYISSDYITDSMNALSSIKQYPGTDPERIGIAGHSMGGNITLHELVISKDIRAAAILSGVVGNYSDILDWWNKRVETGVLTTQNDQATASLIKQFVQQHGTPDKNPGFWDSIDPTNYLSEISVPVQIQVGTSDATVPPNMSFSLRDKLQAAGKQVQLYSYPGADHNLSPDNELAISRVIDFFNSNLK